MADKPKTVKLGSPEFWKSLYDSNFEPHWAIKLLLDPEGIKLPELVGDGEYPIVGSIPWEPVTPMLHPLVQSLVTLVMMKFRHNAPHGGHNVAFTNRNPGVRDKLFHL